MLESLAPRLIRDLNHELRERIRRSPIELNSYGYDPWGFNPDVARRTLLLFALVYRYYFRRPDDRPREPARRAACW